MAADKQDRGPGRTGGSPADMMGVGVQFTATLLLFLFGGKWLDERLGTSPWLLLAGVFLGFVLGVLWLYRRLTWDSKDGGPGGKR